MATRTGSEALLPVLQQLAADWEQRCGKIDASLHSHGMAHLTGNHMKFWEVQHVVGRDSTTGEAVDRFEADLYEQPLLDYLRGKATFAIWMACPRWVTNHHGGRRRLNFELAWTYDIPHRNRRTVEQVRVAPRNPGTWFMPGGDAPWTPSSEPPTLTSPAVPTSDGPSPRPPAGPA